MNNEVIKKLQIKNGKLQIQIERLKLDKEEYYLDYLDLQQRIDKAISYIKENGCFNEEYKLCTEPFNTLKLDDLLGILEGEDNE